MNKTHRKTGVWLIGAYGDIATTLIVGKLAIQNKLVTNSSLITDLPPMQQLALCNLDELIFGGHDIVVNTVAGQAETICERSRTFPYSLLKQITPQLESLKDDIVVTPELAWDTNAPDQTLPTLEELCKNFRHTLKAFIANKNLEHLVVVNVASAEVYTPLTQAHHDYPAFLNLIAADRKDQISPSMLCAYAAFMEHCSYVNFTPNTGASIGALQTLALEHGLPFCGNDGKTGETLVKTALAPMFAARHLQVMSWEGINMLGNGDGKTLNEPENCKNKIQNKEAVLPAILGYPVHSIVDINYVPSLGDWKTAWDLIHFKGFLDVPMTMQFTWQGCDSILAAPLVIDLIRLAEFAHRQGESGPMYHLASFFKNPIGVSEHHFYKQFEMLLAYARKHLDKN
jgi:myo-inositol-1-phosphate synthase